MKKYEHLVRRGIEEPLEKVPFHDKAPLLRLSMLSNSILPEARTHVAVHFVDVTKPLPNYSKPHKHNCDEINLILSEDSELQYEVQLGDETYTVISPSTVFVPKGLKHSARAISGKGIFVCIILSNTYATE